MIDDDADLLAAQAQGLEIEGFSVRAFSSGEQALRHLAADFDGVVLSDVRMPHMDGLKLFEHIRAIDADIPVILLTGHGDVLMAVQALKAGAYDFMTKPFPMDELVASLRRALQNRRLVLENRQLRRAHADAAHARMALLGDSPAMVALRQTLAQIADAEVDVLVTGETGAGKKTIARAIHKLSARRGRPLVQVHCASLPEASFHVDLFGAEAGSRTGGYGGPARRAVGKVEKAHRGTLLLDEVDGLSLPQQARLLEMMEAGEIWPLGAEEPRPVDVRVVATSRTDLAALSRSGEFRADLYYRLSGITLQAPPLSARPGDIRLLFQHFLVGACARLNRPIPTLSTAMLAALQSHDWPGNVRELEQRAERYALGLDEPVVADADDGGGQSLSDRVAAFEADTIRQALQAHRGSAKAAIEALKVPRKTFYEKLAKHRIAIADYR